MKLGKNNYLFFDRFSYSLCFGILMIIQCSLLVANYEQTAFSYNPAVSAEIWVELEPYFLPYDHPIRSKLDRIFSKRVTASPITFEQAGFAKVKLRKPTNIVIGLHPALEGYVIKAYLDTQPPLCEWENWIKRIMGARAIASCIKRYGLRDCVVPRKWIYPLPHKPYPNLDNASLRKNFILVVEDMNILSNKSNLNAYKKKMSRPLLDQIFTIVKEEGLIDSLYPDNMPFTRSGKIAFIDTEHFHLSPVNYNILPPFLAYSMQNYWLSLIEKN